MMWSLRTAVGFLVSIVLASSAMGQEKERVAELSKQALEIASELERSEWGTVYSKFDARMQKAVSQDGVAEIWESIGKQYGKVKAILGTRHNKVEQYDVIFVTCDFERGRMDLKLVFDAANDVSGWFIVSSGSYSLPPYTKPDDITTREVTVGRGLLNLPGTLMLPRHANREKPVPAVVLIHGSGPQDRDETIGPNKPFLDLAYGLSAHGIAVLRYEKRTKHFATIMALQTQSVTVREETVDDAVAAVELLTGQAEVDPQRVFVLGHSLGGNLIPRIAARTPQAAGYIGLAASARPLEDLILQQTEEILSKSELGEEEKVALETLKQQVARVKSPELNFATAASDLPLGIPAAYWLDLRDYRPAEQARDIKARIFLAQGVRDYQVTEDDWKIWKAALADKTNCTLKLYDNLNHLFIAGRGRSSPAEYTIEGHMDAELISDLAAWINQQSQ